MRLTAILITVSCLHLGAAGFSQKISFEGTDVPLKTVLEEVSKQSGYHVFYSQESLKEAIPVTVDLKDVPLTVFLDAVFKKQPFSYSLQRTTIVVSRREFRTDSTLISFSTLVPLGSVIGRVMNENGEPLAGANVIVKGAGNQGASTDVNGYYKIENIATGEYTFVISFIGYVTKTAIIKVTGDNTIAFNFTLALSLVNLDQLTVTSTLSARKIRSYPATIAVINQESLKNRNINNITNVLEAVPGIILSPSTEQGIGSTRRQPFNLLIRGVSAGAQIKYLVDGIEVVSEQNQGDINFLQTLDPNDIEKIEILKGPMASTLYGSGAAGGIISITTKKGKPGKTQFNFKTMFTQYANDFASYSGYNQNYSSNISGGNEQFSYLIGAGYNLYPTPKLSDTSDGLNDNTWSYSAKFRGKLKNISADLSLQYGSEKSGSGSTSVSDNKYRESLGLAPLPIYQLSDRRTSQRNFLTSLHLTHTIAANWYHDLTIGYNVVSSGSNYYTLNYSGAYDNSEYLFSKINARYFMFYEHAWNKVIKSNITAGFEYNGYETHSLYLQSTAPLTNFFTAYTPEAASSATFTKAPYSSTGYFGEIVTSFEDNLFLTTGIRYDVNPAYGNSVGPYPQPRVGLSYVIESDKFKIKPRIVWGVSSLAPEPSYKITSITTSPYATLATIGNPDIKPQRSEGYEFGADLFYNSNYSLNVTYYDQKIKDLIQLSNTYDFNTNPATYYSYYYNIGEAINKGLEISAKMLLDPFTVDLSYTQINSKWGAITGQAPTGTVYPHAPSTSIPKNSFYARLSYHIPSFLKWSKKGGNISLDWRYNGSAFDFDVIGYSLATDTWQNLPDPKPTYPDYNNYYLWQKGYSKFNLRADYSIANFAALYIDIQNLLDKQGSTNGQIYNQFPGRRINFGFNINF